MVAKNLVARSEVPGDRRRAQIKIMTSGQKLLDELFPQSVYYNNAVWQALQPVELAAFDQALTRLTKVAEKLSGSRPLVEKADRRNGASRRFPIAKPDAGLL